MSIHALCAKYTCSARIDKLHAPGSDPVGVGGVGSRPAKAHGAAEPHVVMVGTGACTLCGWLFRRTGVDGEIVSVKILFGTIEDFLVL